MKISSFALPVMKYTHLMVIGILLPSLLLGQDRGADDLQRRLDGISERPEEVEEIIKGLPDDAKCIGLMSAAMTLIQRGDFVPAERLLKQAEQIAIREEGRDPALLGRCSFFQGKVAETLGKGNAIEFFGRASISFARVRQYEMLMASSGAKAVLEEKQGRVPAAILSLEFARGSAALGKHRPTVAEASAQLSRLHSILRQSPEARESFETARDILKPGGTPGDLARLGMLEAAILDMEGKAAAALKLLEKSFLYYSGNREPGIAANCRFNAGLILSKQADIEGSNKLLVEAAFFYAQSGSATGVANAMGQRGNNYLALGDISAAKALILQASVMHEMGGNLMRTAESKLSLGELERKQGRTKESDQYLKSAADLYERCGLKEEGMKKCDLVRKSVSLVKPED